MRSMPRVHIGFGANLGDPRTTLQRAIAALSAEAIAYVRRAPLYRTAPMGPPGQPDYLNTVIEVDTALAPLELLDALKRIEGALGRLPSERWAARAIDLDLLLYGEQIVDHERLTVPHAGLAQRRFVLAPLARLVPSLRVPGIGRTVAELLASSSDDPSSAIEVEG